DPGCTVTKSVTNPSFSGARSGRADCRSLRLLLLSAGESIWARLLQPQTETANPADFTGAFSSFWNLDLVQPWDGWCVANRSRSCVIGRNRSSLFYVGATVAVHSRGFFHACGRKPDRAVNHRTFLPLSFLAPLKRKYFQPVAHRSNEARASCKRTNGFRLFNSASNISTAHCRL